MFEFGVASGDVTASSVTLWTRVPARIEVRWSVFSKDSDVVAESGASAADELGFVHVRVEGLPPGSAYEYEFVCGDAVSVRGRFRTLPESGPVKFAVVTCAKFNSGYFNAYAAVAKRDDLDFVLHLGDYIYEAGQIPRGHQTPGADIGREFDPPHDCVTETDYQRRYALYRRDADLQQLHQSHAMVATIDDHEIADNAWAGGSEVHFESDGSWDERLRCALRAWECWQPTLRRPSTGEPIWMSLPLGAVAAMFICDSRTARSDPQGLDLPSKTILGPQQFDCLATAVAENQRPWMIVAMPSKVMSLDAARQDDLGRFALERLKLAAPDGSPFHDRWDSYPTERDRLLETLVGSSKRTLLLCGDVHFAAFSRMRSGDTEVAECVATSVTSPNLDDKMGWPAATESRPYESQMVELIDEMEWCDLDAHGFMIVELNADHAQCEWWAVPTVLEPAHTASLIHAETLTCGPYAGLEPASSRVYPQI